VRGEEALYEDFEPAEEDLEITAPSASTPSSDSQAASMGKDLDSELETVSDMMDRGKLELKHQSYASSSQILGDDIQTMKQALQSDQPNSRPHSDVRPRPRQASSFTTLPLTINSESLFLDITTFNSEEGKQTTGVRNGSPTSDIQLDTASNPNLLAEFKEFDIMQFASSPNKKLSEQSSEQYPQLLDNFSDTRDRINKWILHALLLSPVEATMLKGEFDHENDPKTSNWSQLVMAWWSKDGATVAESTEMVDRDAISWDEITPNISSRKHKQRNQSLPHTSTQVTLRDQPFRGSHPHLPYLNGSPKLMPSPLKRSSPVPSRRGSINPADGP